eukprot:tig00001336_g8224.t1
MKFGKLLESSLANRCYREHCLDYKQLKKHIKDIGCGVSHDASGVFCRCLEAQLEVVNDHYFSREEDAVIRLKMLEDEVQRLNSGKNVDVAALRKSLVDFHGELVSLEEYAALNFTGLLKIMKKYMKKIGHNQSPTNVQQRFLEQPFYTNTTLPQMISKIHSYFHMLDLHPAPPSCPLTDAAAAGPAPTQSEGGESASTEGRFSLDDLVGAAEFVGLSSSKCFRNVRLLQLLLEKINAADVLRLIAQADANDAAASHSAPAPDAASRIRITHLARTPGLALSVWELPPKGTLPLHDRGDTIAVTRVLRGSCKLLSYDWEQAQASGSSEEEAADNASAGLAGPSMCPAAKRQRLESTAESSSGDGACAVPCAAEGRLAARQCHALLTPERPSCVSWPTKGGNLRSLTASGAGACTVVDLIVPVRREGAGQGAAVIHRPFTLLDFHLPCSDAVRQERPLSDATSPAEPVPALSSRASPTNARPADRTLAGAGVAPGAAESREPCEALGRSRVLLHQRACPAALAACIVERYAEVFPSAAPEPEQAEQAQQAEEPAVSAAAPEPAPAA